MSKHPPNLHTIPALQRVMVNDHLNLKTLQTTDWQGILNILAADENIRQRVAVASRLHTQADINKEVARYHADAGLIRYVLWKDNLPVGMVSLWRDDGFFGTPFQPNDYGFGYFLDPSQRGKGLIAQAVQTLMDTIALTLPVRQFVAFCEDDNKGGTRVLQRLGFSPTDELFSEPDHGWLERKYVKKMQLHVERIADSL